MNPRLLIALVVACLAALGTLVAVASQRDEGGVAGAGAERFEGAIVPPGLRAPDFALTDQDGERITMRELRGEPVIVTFLYTTCEDTCPTQAQQVRATLDELGEDVPVLAIAVDPPRDTPRSARAFLSEQSMLGRMDFVLGSRTELKRLWDAYAVQPQREDLEHTARLVVVDPAGRQRVSFPLDQITPENLAHDVRLLAADR